VVVIAAGEAARLLDAVKQRAKAQGIPYTRFIQRLMEQAVNKPEKTKLELSSC
jgi:predicted DNA binding CopG/RHH family protein